MQKLYENFHIFHFQKRIVSAETIPGNTVVVAVTVLTKRQERGRGEFEGREPFVTSKWLDKLCENTSFALHCTI